MKYLKTLIIPASAAILLLFCSCGSDTVTPTNNVPPVDTSSFTYPFGIGSSWNFNRLYKIENIRPDSIRHLFSNYPINGTGTITIMYDTIINGINTRCFHEIYSDISVNGASSQYLTNTGSSMICYAYRSNNESSGIPDNYMKSLIFKKGDLIFKNFMDIENNLKIKTMQGFNPDSLFILNPPDTCLKYPVVKGSEWLYKSNSFVSIHKNYLSFENLYVNGNYVSVIKTKRTYSYSFDIDSYDYYSKYGELKKEFSMSDVIVTNEFGQEVGMVDLNDTYTINSYNILNP